MNIEVNKKILNIKLPKSEKPHNALPKTLTKAQAQYLTELPEKINARNKERDRMIFLTFLNSGLRNFELRSLRVQDLNFETGKINVIGKGNKQRMVPMSSKLFDELKSYVEDKKLNDSVFPALNGGIMASGTLKTIIIKYEKPFLEKYPEVDGVYFGDDFGTQTGLQMGSKLWTAIIKPKLVKQYGFARQAGKKVFIHSCGKVQELFDDFVEIGVDCFNPFQPEVMDVQRYLDEYHGRLAFHGGISTQKLLPYGSVIQVEAEVDELLKKGRKGGYIISPAHATPGDAKTENICAMLRKILDQPFG